MRILKMTMITTVAVLALSSAAAYAQDGKSSGGGSGVEYEEVTKYDFENDVIEGALLRPDGELLSGQRHGKQSSLINIRADFIPEMIRSAEEL